MHSHYVHLACTQTVFCLLTNHSLTSHYIQLKSKDTTQLCTKQVVSNGQCTVLHIAQYLHVYQMVKGVSASGCAPHLKTVHVWSNPHHYAAHRYHYYHRSDGIPLPIDEVWKWECDHEDFQNGKTPCHSCDRLNDEAAQATGGPGGPYGCLTPPTQYDDPLQSYPCEVDEGCAGS